MVALMDQAQTTALNEAIENLRLEMNQLSDKLGLSHPQVQECSERLDQLLIAFYLLRKSKRNA